MPTRKIRCPECDVRLVQPPGAEAIECPRCEHIFSAPDDRDEDEEDDGAGAPAARSPFRALLFVGLGTAALGAAAAGALVLVRSLNREPDQGAVGPVAVAPLPQKPAPPVGTPAPPPPLPQAPAIAPAADDADPFRPADPVAAAAVAELDRYAAEGPAIPQDEARAKALRTAHLEWCRDTTELAFGRVGRTDAPWAAKARTALALRAKEMAIRSPFASHSPEDAPSAAALAAAVADGCDDPLVQYFHLQAQRAAGAVPPDRVLAEARRVTQLVWDSRYADARKIHAVHNLLAQFHEHRAPADEIATWDKRFWELLTKVSADPDPVNQDNVIELTTLRERQSMSAGRSRQKAHEEIAACLKKGGAPEATQLAVRGAFLIRYAWDARGYGYANTVTPDGWRQFSERLAEAEEALTAAHERDPNRPHAATSMLTVCMGRSHPRDEMERWFERAMRADPDNAQACATKVESLHPKWQGSQEEYLGFAWQCVRTRNVNGLLPLAAVSNLTANMPVPEPVLAAAAAQARPQYSQPLVWRVLDTGYTVVRRERPELLWVRGSHARAACLAGQHGVAVRELNAVGDDFSGGGFRSPAALARYRTWARTGRPPGG
ncbi:hypothetical protein R5W24_002778 [Gemmata sp. JC717]|uniref:hypothetical protein n=1 Tax=Gemmata algarum TaxID=2975278 RepID=UPI0021BB7C7F|nr:hypothetical protein [Gemmata algarum]MDY3553673.1 hypothetical protein [Gemmata algarum]